MDFLDNLRISSSKLFYCCMYCSSCNYSSAICERLFARFVMGFDDDQDDSLEDYKSAATIIRYDRSLM